MTYEDKMRLLAHVRPEKKDELLMRIARGEIVDITKDEDLFYQINIDRVGMEKLVEREKYRPLVEHMKDARDVMTNEGWNKDKTRKYLGEIPAELYFTHPWFSPTLSKEEKDKNIRKFFKLFPQFGIKGK